MNRETIKTAAMHLKEILNKKPSPEELRQFMDEHKISVIGSEEWIKDYLTTILEEV